MRVENLLKNTISQHTLNEHKRIGRSECFFSGAKKKVGDKFFLGMLLVPDKHEDLQIIIDICEEDILNKTYENIKIE